MESLPMPWASQVTTRHATKRAWQLHSDMVVTGTDRYSTLKKSEKVRAPLQDILVDSGLALWSSRQHSHGINIGKVPSGFSVFTLVGHQEDYLARMPGRFGNDLPGR